MVHKSNKIYKTALTNQIQRSLILMSTSGLGPDQQDVDDMRMSMSQNALRMNSSDTEHEQQKTEEKVFTLCKTCLSKDTEGELRKNINYDIINMKDNGLERVFWLTNSWYAHQFDPVERGFSLHEKEFGICLPCFKNFIEFSGISIHARGQNATSTPLSEAVDQGRQDIVRYLIEKKVNVNARYGLYDKTALHTWSTCLNFNTRTSFAILKQLVDQGADVNQQSNQQSDRITPLMRAIRELNRLMMYLTEDSRRQETWRKNYSDEDIVEELEVRFKCINYLLDCGDEVKYFLDLSISDNDGNTALEWICFYEKAQKKKQALVTPDEIQRKSKWDKTLLGKDKLVQLQQEKIKMIRHRIETRDANGSNLLSLKLRECGGLAAHQTNYLR